MSDNHLGYTPEVYTKMLNNEAIHLYNRFTDTLRSLKEVTEPSARKLFIDDLKDCLDEANKLMDTDLLSEQALTKVKIILQRPYSEYLALMKVGGSVLI